MSDTFIHPTAIVEDGAQIGPGTQIWHHAHVRAGAVVGGSCVVGKGAYLGAGISVGDGCKIQNYAMLFEGCTVEGGVFIGPAALLANDRYPRAITPDGSVKTAADWTMGSVRIEEGASIGAGAIVVPNAVVGRWAMVGSGAVVTHDVAAHTLVAGNPARTLGYVCSCGHRLATDEGAWRCPSCDRSFLLPQLVMQAAE